METGIVLKIISILKRELNREYMSIIFKNKKYDPDAAIFDVDGTIWDSTGVVEEAWNKALVDTGFGDTQVTADRLKGLFGLPMIEIMRDILPNVEEKELRHFEEICNEYEEDYILKKAGKIYDGIIEVIKKLSEKMPVIIVSNCQSGYIELMMNHLGINEYVTDHVCPGDSGLLKADNILLMCEKHGIKKPVYIGDTSMDANACEQADVPMIFATYGFGKVENPAAIIDEPADLLKLLLK